MLYYVTIICHCGLSQLQYIQFHLKPDASGCYLFQTKSVSILYLRDLSLDGDINLKYTHI